MALSGRLIKQNRPRTGIDPSNPLGLPGAGGGGGDGGGAEGTFVTEITNSGSGTGSGQAALNNAALAKRKYEDELVAAGNAAARTRAGTLASGEYIRKLLAANQQPFSGLESEIAEQETAGRTYIEDQAKMLSDLISGRRTQAMNTTTSGYDALRDFLTANPMQAYAQTQAAVPTVQNNALEQYLASRGVGSQPAQAGQDVANAQLAAQAGNYNQLLNVLQGAEAQQQSSRVAEEQMARALAGTQLEALYGAQTSGLEQQRLAAINDLLSRSSTARISAEQLRLAREQQLQDAIAKLLGTGLPTEEKDFAAEIAAAYAPKEAAYNRPAQTNEQIAELRAIQEAARLDEVRGGGVKTSPSVAALAAIPVKASNTALQKRIDDFVAAKPRASAAAVAEEFPQLTAALAKKKKK
jgi:hypothetical protein